MKMHKDDQRGYTLIELSVAAALLGFFLMVIMAGFISMVKMNQKGQAARLTQQGVRFAVEEMVRATREAGQVDGDAGSVNGQLCLVAAGRKVKYFTKMDVSEGYVRLYKLEMSASGDCSSETNGSLSVVTAKNVTAQALTITVVGADPSSVEIVLTLAAGRTDVNGVCDGTAAYCSVATLKSSANLRGVR